MPVIIDEHTQYTDVDGKPLVNGKIFIGVVNQDPVLNPTPIFSNRELTIVLANPQTLNSRGQSPTKIYSAGRYSFRLENSAASQIEQDLDRGENVSSEGAISLDNVTGINTITATADPTIVGYVDTQQYIFIAASTNTGSVTLNIDNIGAKSIKEQGAELGAGRIVANSSVLVIFNSVLDIFELVGGTDLSSPGPIGQTTADVIDGTVIKATTRFEGVLGSTNPANVTSTVLKANTSIQAVGGAAITEFETTLSSSTTKAPTSSAVNTAINAGPPNGTVDQGALKTTTGDVTNGTSAPTLITGAGGEFGFWPTVKHSISSARRTEISVANSIDNDSGTCSTTGTVTLGTTFLQRFCIASQGTGTITVRSRFVQASPPYDIGDGEVHSFIFLLIDNLGKILSGYHAPDPVWANNGPTCIRPEYFKNGKAYRMMKFIDKLKEFKSPDRIKYMEQEITADFKNSDMALIPHPFQGNDMTGKSVVLIDPNDSIVETAEQMKEAGEFALEQLFHNDYVRFGNEHLAGRKTPSNQVMVVKPTWKNTQ